MLVCRLLFLALLSSPALAQLLSFAGNASSALWCPPSSSCTSVIRLTNATLNASGAVWTNFPLNIAQGFNVSFSFRITQKSQSCPLLEDVYAYCLARGGHGFAFVIQGSAAASSPSSSLGYGAEGLGYTGLQNCVALEFDTWYDELLNDGYDNHISIQGVEPSLPLSNDHRFTLGMTSDIPEMVDENQHDVVVVYSPTLSPSFFHPELCKPQNACERVQTTPQFSSLLDKGYFDHGVGSVLVYFDDPNVPRFISPLSLPPLLSTSGLAAVGFTGSTGPRQYQVHDIWNWKLCSIADSQCYILF